MAHKAEIDAFLELACFFSDPAAAAAKSLQSCPTLCDPIDGSPWGSPIPVVLQARTLEWVTISFSSSWKWKVKVKSLSRVWLLAAPWTADHQAPPSIGFSRQEYWSGVPLPSPNDPAEVGNLISETNRLWKELMDLKSRLIQSVTCSQIEINQFMFKHYRYKKCKFHFLIASNHNEMRDIEK